MIISRTPFRISFLGGGTDYPVWYEKHGGAVIGTSINKYCYITCRYLPPFFKYNYRIRYTKQEHKKKISQIEHPSVRGCFNFLQINEGIEMQHNADVPAMSGLGSSSSFTVGLLNALYALRDQMVDKKRLALDAIYVEQKIIKEHVGSQDQTLVSFGGLNKIEFGIDGKINVTPIMLGQAKFEQLQNHLMLFYTRQSRKASDIAKTQIKATRRKIKDLKTMKSLVDEGYKILINSKTSFVEFGKLLHESWKIKRCLTTKISNSAIDEMYQAALDAGAIGGKLLGAGGGGFMLLFVRPDDKLKVKEKLKKLLEVPFRFESNGSQIIYKMPDDSYQPRMHQ